MLKSRLVSHGDGAPRRRAGLTALLTAVAIASVGEAMMIVAVPWFVLQTTGSVARTGIVVAVASVGAGAAGFAAGPLIDRWGFKPTTVVSYLFGGTAAAGIPLLHALGRLDFATLVALVLFASLLDIPGVTAVTGLVPALAGAARMPLERANGLLTAVRQVSQLCGPALGGLGVALLGTASVLLINAGVCALAALVVTAGVAAPARSAAPAPERPAGGYTAELRAGLRTLRQHRLLRTLTASSTAFNGLDSGLAGVVLVTYAYQHLGSAGSLGVLLTAFGIGTAAGSLTFAVVGHRLGRRRTFLAAGFAAGLLIAGLAALPPLPLGAALLAVLGAVAAPVAPLRTGALQRGIPEGQYGRVVAAIDTVALSAVPLGATAAVALVGGVGLSHTVLVISGAYLLVVAGCWAAPGLREM